MGPHASDFECDYCGRYLCTGKCEEGKRARAQKRIVSDFKTENSAMKRAIKECLATFYVGEGKVVCSDALLPHLRKFSQLLKRFG